MKSFQMNLLPSFPVSNPGAMRGDGRHRGRGGDSQPGEARQVPRRGKRSVQTAGQERSVKAQGLEMQISGSSDKVTIAQYRTVDARHTSERWASVVVLPILIFQTALT